MEPYQRAVEIVVPNTYGGENAFISVPNDRRLVIEHISGEGFCPFGQKLLFGIKCTANGNEGRHYLGSHTIGNFGAVDYYWFTGLVKFYADPGSSVMLRVDRDIAKDEAKARMTLSGYLEWP